MNEETKPPEAAQAAAAGATPTPLSKLDTFHRLLDDLDAGAFAQALSVALNEVSLGTALYGDKNSKGKLVIELGMRAIDGTTQVKLAHKIRYTRPTAKGNRAELLNGEAVMFVERGGGLSVFQADQLELGLADGGRRS